MATTAAARKKADFDKTYAALKRLLSAMRKETKVIVDKPNDYCVVSKTATYRDKPAWFGGVRKGKTYVSFHLFPVYAIPELGKRVSPALKKRQQGKGCFNFTAPDAKLFRELATLTRAGAAAFRKKKVFVR